MRRSATLRNDRGAAAIELPAAVVILLIPVTMLLLVLPQWPERQGVARALAHEAAVTMANAASSNDGADRAAQLAAETAANHGLPSGSLRLAWSGDWCRGCSITATVTVDIPAVRIPFIGSTGTFTRSTSSTQRIDDYRSISQ